MFKNLLSSLCKSYVLLNVLGMCLLVCFVVVGFVFATSVYTHHGERIVVPDVSHMGCDDAFVALEHVGLVPVVTDTGYNRLMATGAVLLQQPVAGCVVKSGREIYLTINSRESPTVSLPAIADNCDVHEAQTRLMAMGFKVGPCEYVEGDKDWVFGVKCRGRVVHDGERVPCNAVLTLVVGDTDMEDGDDEEAVEEMVDFALEEADSGADLGEEVIVE